MIIHVVFQISLYTYLCTLFITFVNCLYLSAGLLDLTIALDLSRYLLKEKEYVPWDAALSWLHTLAGRLVFTSVYGRFQVTIHVLIVGSVSLSIAILCVHITECCIEYYSTYCIVCFVVGYFRFLAIHYYDSGGNSPRTWF